MTVEVILGASVFFKAVAPLDAFIFSFFLSFIVSEYKLMYVPPLSMRASVDGAFSYYVTCIRSS